MIRLINRHFFSARSAKGGTRYSIRCIDNRLSECSRKTNMDVLLNATRRVVGTTQNSRQSKTRDGRTLQINASILCYIYEIYLRIYGINRVANNETIANR